MKQNVIPRHIRVQTPEMLLRAAHTPPAAGGNAPQVPPPDGTFIAPARMMDRIMLVVAESLQVSPANEYRRYLLLVNQGANALRIGVGQPATADTGLSLPANGFWEPLVPPMGGIFAFSTLGSTLLIIEG